MDVATAQIEHVDIETLRPDPANPRKISDAELESLTRSLREWGFVQPVLVRREDNAVIGGHQRLLAARRLGLKQVPVIYIDLPQEQARLLNLALNRISGSWDEELLAQMLANFQANETLDLSLSGFCEKELDRLLRTLDAREKREKVEAFDVDAALEAARRATRAEPGQLWAMGGHRLLVGDSTDTGAVSRLLDGERPVLMATDPPYLVDYAGAASKNRNKGGREGHWDDFEGAAQALKFYTDFLRAALPHLADDAAIYQWHAHRRQALVEQAWRDAGLLMHEQLIWVKPRGVPTRSHFMWQHEPCFYGWVEGHAPKRRPPKTETTVWQIDHQGEQLGVHPTQKPLALFERPIAYHTEPNDVCYEPFAGSGTQVIACERLGRRCYAVERDPHYCAVVLARWEAFSGMTAEKIAEKKGRRDG